LIRSCGYFVMIIRKIAFQLINQLSTGLASS
jgi:hypothetical protein